MNLPLHQILPGEPVPLYAQNVDDSCTILASCRIASSSRSSSNTPSTLRIHSLYPLSKVRISERCPPNVRSVHPYGTSNLLFLVLSQNRKGKAREGSNVNDDASSYKIVLWDDKKEETMLELTFRDPVLNVVLRRDKLVVILERRVVLFHLDLSHENRAEAMLREGEYETVSNPLGLASIATTTGSTLLAFPGRQVGHAQLIRLPPLKASAEPAHPPAAINPRASSNAPPPYPIIHIFQAHSSPLRTLTLSQTGSLLCTSSNKGTLLRVFSTIGSNKSLLRELRRGSDQADIWSVAFLNPDKGEMIACASDKRTVHVWKVGDVTSHYSSSTSSSNSTSSAAARNAAGGLGMSGKEKEKDTSRAFNLLKPYLPAYFSSQWSDLSWRIPHNASVTFQASHVAALAEQDDVATCFFVESPTSSETHAEEAHIKHRKKTAVVKEDPFYLLVITRSGAWYKLSIPQISTSNKSTGSSKSTVPSSLSSSSSKPRTHRVSIQDDRENIRPIQRTSSTASSSARASAGNTTARTEDAAQAEEDEKKCKLVEYKRIGYGSDGDDEENNEDYEVHISESGSEDEDS